MKFLLSTASGLLFMLSFDAFAQSEEDPQSPDDDPPLETIMVTGTKQERTLQDLDIAATVLGQQALRDARVTDIRRIDDLVPNVQFNDSGPLGAVYISIRGVESNPFIVNRAAVYIDGIPFRELNNSVLTQLASVEVLRGPQSTLYGSNTESGLIVINTRPPSEEFTANIGFTSSVFDTGEAYQGEGYIGSSIIENTLAGSVSFRYSGRDYFLQNIGATPRGQGHIDEVFIQGRLRWTPSDALTVDVTSYIIDTGAPGIYRFDGFPVDIERYNAVYSDGILFDPDNPFSPPPVNGDLRATDFQFVHDAPKRADIREYVGGISATYATGHGTIDAAFSYRSDDTDDFGFDIDGSNGPFLAGAQVDSTELFNTELRYSSPPDQALEYTIGVSYYEEDSTERLGSLLGPGGTLSDFNFAPDQSVTSKDFGVFGSVSYSLPSIPKLTGTFGLRYDRAFRRTRQEAGMLDLGFNVFVFDALELENTFDTFLPRFALLYKASDTLTLYTNVAKGYLPGGFNITAAQDGFQEDVIEYGSESLWNYEIGAKWSAPGQKAFLAVSAFFIETENYQEISALVDDEGNILSTSFIGSDAAIESYGFEIEGQWVPFDGLTLTGNLGVVEAEYTDFARARAENVIGNPVQLIPAYDANLAARYQHSSGWFARAEINFIGETALDTGDRTGFNLNAVDTQESVEIIGLQLGYETDIWTARFFAENLTNVRRISGAGFPNAFFPADGLLYGAVDAPRVIGLELTFTY